MEDTVVGHYHKTTENNERTMNGDIISVRSTGCLCGLTPHYMPVNGGIMDSAYCELNIKTSEYFLRTLK